MIRSMTGFGKASAIHESNSITVEVRSLNSKFLEFNLRLPYIYKEKEMELRNELSKAVERGKADIVVTIEPAPGVRKSSLNTDVINNYFQDLMGLRKEIGLTSEDYMNVIMRLPNVINTDKTEADEKEWLVIAKLIAEAMKGFNSFREREGSMLQQDFTERIHSIEEKLTAIEKLEPGRMEAIRNRLKKGVSEVAESLNLDENRFEQELIYYLEKIDITEEKVRLRSHLSFFLETLKKEDSAGKKLGFILQEIGREINTIGSKANDAGIQRLVVEMKDELEKMKEQGANVV
ncbi:MAG TPA: YicC/YloC family endoribonuclease [Bacteroidia bacterium]|nr:YicC/YloC family endoribonuclease [Bacteroidia bacterium]